MARGLAQARAGRATERTHPTACAPSSAAPHRQARPARRAAARRPQDARRLYPKPFGGLHAVLARATVPGRRRADLPGRDACTAGGHCCAGANLRTIAPMQTSAERAGAPLRMGAVDWGLIGLQSMLWGSSYFFI